MDTELDLRCTSPEAVRACAGDALTGNACLALCSTDVDCQSLGADAACGGDVCVAPGGASNDPDGDASASDDSPAPNTDSGMTESTPDPTDASDVDVDSGLGAAPGASTPPASAEAGGAVQTGDEADLDGGDEPTIAEGGSDSADASSDADDARAPDAGEGPPVSGDAAASACEAEALMSTPCSEPASVCVAGESCCECWFDPETPACGPYWVCATPQNNNPEFCPAEPPTEGEACIGPVTGLQVCSYCLSEGPGLLFCARQEIGSGDGIWSRRELAECFD